MIKKIELEEVDSTNSYLLASDYAVGTAVIAKEQYAGRGRSGRSWQSSAGNLYMSIVLPNIEPSRLFGLQIVCGYAAVAALKSYAAVKLKWPNDLMLHGKKIGGILVETRFGGGKLLKTVVGIGVNSAQSPAGVSDTASSLGLTLGVTNNELFDRIYDSVLLFVNRYIDDGIDISAVWGDYTFAADSDGIISFHKNGVKIFGLEEGITSEGYLIARERDDNGVFSEAVTIITGADSGS